MQQFPHKKMRWPFLFRPGCEFIQNAKWSQIYFSLNVNLIKYSNINRRGHFVSASGRIYYPYKKMSLKFHLQIDDDFVIANKQHQWF